MKTYKKTLFFLINILFFSTIQLHIHAMQTQNSEAKLIDPIHIICNDEKKFKMEKDVAKRYLELLKDMLEEEEEENNEEINIPLPNVSSIEFMLIKELIDKAEEIFAENKRKNQKTCNSKLKARCSIIIAKKQLPEDKIKELFKAADYLNAKLILAALAYDLINKNPVKYLSFIDKKNIENVENKEKIQNPLDLEGIQIKHYKMYMEKNIYGFIFIKSQRTGFNKWFEKAKSVPGLATRVGETIYHFARNLKPETIKKVFEKTKEENLFKMILRLKYFLSTKENIDSLNLNNACHFYKENWIINKIKQNLSPTNKTVSQEIINMYLYAIGSIQSEKKELISVHLGNCKLTEIPDALLRCDAYKERLIKLFLKNNQLQSFSGNFPKLQKLSLNKNDLEELPEFICELEELETLEIVATKINLLPKNIINMKNLKRLTIDKNMITANRKLLDSLENKNVKISIEKPIPLSLSSDGYYSRTYCEYKTRIYISEILKELQDKYSAIIDELRKNINYKIYFYESNKFTKEQIQQDIEKEAIAIEKREKKSKKFLDNLTFEEFSFKGIPYLNNKKVLKDIPQYETYASEILGNLKSKYSKSVINKLKDHCDIKQHTYSKLTREELQNNIENDAQEIKKQEEEEEEEEKNHALSCFFFGNEETTTNTNVESNENKPVQRRRRRRKK